MSADKNTIITAFTTDFTGMPPSNRIDSPQYIFTVYAGNGIAFMGTWFTLFSDFDLLCKLFIG